MSEEMKKPVEEQEKKSEETKQEPKTPEYKTNLGRIIDTKLDWVKKHKLKATAGAIGGGGLVYGACKGVKALIGRFGSNSNHGADGSDGSQDTTTND